MRPGSAEFDSIQTELREKLEAGGMELEALVSIMNEESETVIQVIEHLLEEGIIIRGKDMKITLA